MISAMIDKIFQSFSIGKKVGSPERRALDIMLARLYMPTSHEVGIFLSTCY